MYQDLHCSSQQVTWLSVFLCHLIGLSSKLRATESKANTCFVFWWGLCCRSNIIWHVSHQDRWVVSSTSIQGHNRSYLRVLEAGFFHPVCISVYVLSVCVLSVCVSFCMSIKFMWCTRPVGGWVGWAYVVHCCMCPVSLLSGYARHRNPNSNTEIIWLGN